MGVPDWLSELAPEAESDDAPDMMEDASAEDLDLMDDLRGQLGGEGAGAEAAPVPKSSPKRRRNVKKSSRGASSSLGLQAWQRFVLSVLLFFNVAVIGLMLLIMLGRIGIF